MSANFEPRLDILRESQLRLWPELDAVWSDFVLYGGTGLARNSGIEFLKTLTSFHRLVLNRSDCDRGYPFFGIWTPQTQTPGCIISGIT
jgi:hypothetical protein